MEVWPFIVYATVMTITPGPNNMMVLASGVQFGVARTWPHMWGIASGFAVQLFAVAIGLGAMFQAYPLLQTILKIAGLAYLLWLAWLLVGAGALQDRAAARPLRFFEAALFQWVNPKAWVMSISAASLFMPPGWPVFGAGALFAGIAFAICIPSVWLWASFGEALRRFLARPGPRRVFNMAMALALIATGLAMIV